MRKSNHPLHQSRLPTPIKPDVLLCYLYDIRHPDTDYLVNGFTHGFRIGFDGVPHSVELSNHGSFYKHSQFAKDYISKELSAERIAGPFDIKPDGLIVSPLGLIEKKNKNDFRVIQDFSMPKSAGSINSGIADKHAVVAYELFDHVARMITALGRGCLIAKTDVKAAFRICPVSPLDYYLLGFKIGEQYYHDRVLTMGCRSSCQIFERFSTAIQDILRIFYHVTDISHILDDFIFMGNARSGECQRGLEAFHHLATKIGLPIKEEKTVQPTTSIVLHGLLVDTHSMTASLPADKLQRVINQCQDMLSRRKVKLKQLLSLIGLLQFATKVTPGGRAFLRRLIDLTCGVSNLEFYVRLTHSAKADLAMWYRFMSNYSGVSMLLDYRWLTSEQLGLQTDAAQSCGFGAVFNNCEWVCGTFSAECKSLNIAILEFIPIVIALNIWAPNLENKCVRLDTDNMALVHIINSQTSKDPTIMILLRKFVLCLLENNILLRAYHISSANNAVSDAISRSLFQKARQLLPSLNKHPVEIPSHLQPCALLREN